MGALNARAQRSGNQLPLPPFALEIPRAGCCPQGGGTSLEHGSGVGAGQAALAAKPVPALCGECGLTTGVGQQVSGLGGCYGGKQPQAFGIRHQQLPGTERVPSAGTAAPGVLRSCVASLLPSPPAPSQQLSQHLRAGFSSCHGPVTGCRWPWHPHHVLCRTQPLGSHSAGGGETKRWQRDKRPSH